MSGTREYQSRPPTAGAAVRISAPAEGARGKAGVGAEKGRLASASRRTIRGKRVGSGISTAAQRPATSSGVRAGARGVG
eukprot:2047521-Rhodomonas_salina.2